MKSNTGRPELAQRKRNSLELSGVNRLLALAQELGVRGTKNVARPERPQREAVEESVRRGDGREGDGGLKLSLSETASRLAETLAKAPSTSVPASTSAANPAPPSRTPESRSSPNSSQPRIDPKYAHSRRGAGIAAYEKNAGTIPGERIRVIA